MREMIQHKICCINETLSGGIGRLSVLIMCENFLEYYIFIYILRTYKYYKNHGDMKNAIATK
jgi:hypothetical protein